MKLLKHGFVRYNAPVWACLALIALLLVLPTGFEGNRVFQESDIRPALVLSTDESTVIDTGLVRSGGAAVPAGSIERSVPWEARRRTEYAQRLSGAGQALCPRR